MAGPLPSIKFIKGNSKNPIVPGVCIIDDRYKFCINRVLSDGETKPISLFYHCGMKRTSKCTASVVLTKVDDKWWAQNLSADEMHNHATDRGAILAAIMKKEMFNKISKHPETKADDAYSPIVLFFVGNDDLGFKSTLPSFYLIDW